MSDPFQDSPEPTDKDAVRITFKAGSAYKDPWITVDFASVSEALDGIDSKFAELAAKVSDAAASYHRAWEAAQKKAESVPAPGTLGKPKGASVETVSDDELPFADSKPEEAADPEPVYICDHGKKRDLITDPKTGRKGHVCVARPAGHPERCKPLMVN